MAKAYAYLLAGAALILMALPASMSALGGSYESPPTFSPSKILPPNLLWSPWARSTPTPRHR
jgi:hypothetical protein